VERLAIVSQSSAKTVHDPLDPLRRNPTVLGDTGNGNPGTGPISVSVHLSVSGDAVPVSTVHLLAIPVRHHRFCELHPADAAHLIGKDTSEQNEVSRILEVRQGRKHPQVGDLSR
jgi:hypothetical protein